MSSRSISIIDELYGREVRSRRRPGILRRLFTRFRKPHPPPRALALIHKRDRLITARRLVIICGVVLVVSLLVVSIYYYNSLVRMEQDVFKEQAKIASLLQRRHNISTNLARTVRDYAIHEQAIFQNLVNKRALSQGGDQAQTNGTPAIPPQATPSPAAEQPASTADEAQPTATPQSDGVLATLAGLLEGKGPDELSLDGKLPGLLALAEQYPDLKLSENFRRFMDALVETEKELSAERMTYAEVINSYTTKLRTFPGALFAKIYSFEEVPYFTADSVAQQFTPVEY